MKSLNLTTAAALSLCFAALTIACSNSGNYGEQPSADAQIKYTVTASNISRAQNVYGSANTPADLRVYARTASDNALYIDGDRLVKYNDTDAYLDEGDPRFWPGNDALNFYALNADTPISLVGSDLKIADYTVDADPARQIDLMYATAPGRVSGSVHLNFRHAMSQIVFTAKNFDLGHNILISRLAIGNVASTGSFIIPELMTTTEEVNGVWTDLGPQNALYSINFPEPVLIKGTRETPVTLPDAANPYGDTYALMLIPQTRRAWNGIFLDNLNGSYLLMEYAAVDKISGETVQTFSVYSPFGINWQPGRRYTYTLNFSDDSGASYQQAAFIDLDISSL